MSAGKLIIVAVVIAISSPAASSPHFHDRSFLPTQVQGLGDGEARCGNESSISGVQENSPASSPKVDRLHIKAPRWDIVSEPVDEFPLHEHPIRVGKNFPEISINVEIPSISLFLREFAVGDFPPSESNKSSNAVISEQRKVVRGLPCSRGPLLISLFTVDEF